MSGNGEIRSYRDFLRMIASLRRKLVARQAATHEQPAHGHSALGTEH